MPLGGPTLPSSSDQSAIEISTISHEPSANGSRVDSSALRRHSSGRCTAQHDYKAMQNRGCRPPRGSLVAAAKEVLQAKAAGDSRTYGDIALEHGANVDSVYNQRSKERRELGLVRPRVLSALPAEPSTTLRELSLGDGLGVVTYEHELPYAGESRLEYGARANRNYRRRRAAPRAALRLEGEVEVEVEQEESESEESEAAAMSDGDEVEEVALPFPSSTAAAPPRVGEEVEISAASGLLPEHLPHQRALCPLHPFHAAERPVAAPVDGNEAACPNCYCLICDARVSECRHWRGGDPAHCNAHGDSALWRQKRVTAKRQRTRAAQVTQARIPCGTPGCSREAYHNGLCSAERAGGRTRFSG